MIRQINSEADPAAKLSALTSFLTLWRDPCSLVQLVSATFRSPVRTERASSPASVSQNGAWPRLLLLSLHVNECKKPNAGAAAKGVETTPFPCPVPFPLAQATRSATRGTVLSSCCRTRRWMIPPASGLKKIWLMWRASYPPVLSRLCDFLPRTYSHSRCAARTQSKAGRSSICQLSTPLFPSLSAPP